MDVINSICELEVKKKKKKLQTVLLDAFDSQFHALKGIG